MVKQQAHPPLDLPPALEVRGLRVSYGALPVLEDVGFALPAGRLVGIIGPNGAGKTTMLKSILGLVPIQAGTVTASGAAGMSPTFRSAMRSTGAFQLAWPMWC